MNILDLDNISSWDQIYNRFIRNDPFWDSIESAISSEVDDPIRRILVGLDYSIEHVKSEELRSLRQRCYEQFKGTYTHVAAYHACRPTCKNSYFRNGIIPANTEALIEKAKILFNNSSAVDEAVKDIKKDRQVDYFEHGRGKIGLFISSSGSLESGYSHYLQYGCELFQSIAHRLGAWAIQKLLNHGTPTLFQCAVPISWLDKFTTFPMGNRYALAPLVQLLLRYCPWKKELDGIIRGAFLLTRPLPKELILNAIDMTPFFRNGKTYLP